MRDTATVLPQTQCLVAQGTAWLARAGADAGGKVLRERGRCQRPFPRSTALAAGAGWDGTDCNVLSQACDKATSSCPHTPG